MLLCHFVTTPMCQNKTLIKKKGCTVRISKGKYFNTLYCEAEKNPNYMLQIQHLLLTSHESQTEAFQKGISERLWHKPRLPIALSILMLPTEKVHHQAKSLLGSGTLPLISKTSIAGNMVWLMAVPSPVLAKNSSSLRISLFSIVKLYRWPKVLEPAEMLSSRGTTWGKIVLI